MGTGAEDAEDAGTRDDLGYANLYDRSAVPTLTIDHTDRVIVGINRAGLDFLGLEAAQVLGRPGADFLLVPSPDELQRVRSLRGEETESVRQMPTVLGLRTVEIKIVPAGVKGVAFVQAIDLTELVEAGARTEARTEELAATSAALRTIASRLAHDLRGPMAAIAGFADLLLHPQTQLDAAQQERVLQRISANTHALVAMTSSILSEADSGPVQPEDSSHEVQDLFRSLRAVTDAQIAEAAGTLDLETRIATLPVPVGRLRQALVNLVSNSVKYRDPSRSLRVAVEVRSYEGGTQIMVRDNGQGLPDDPAALFEAGTRGLAAEGTVGAGLGLAFVRAAIESIGGTVAAQPAAEGAEILIVLPELRSRDDAAPRPPAETARSGITAPQLERIIDSSPVAMLVIDIPARQIVRVNQTACHLLGLDEAEVIGHPGSEFLAEPEVADALRIGAAHEPGQPQMARTHLRTARGLLGATVWMTVIDGTALAVAQVVADEPAI